jgi:uncharacterized protein YjbI with pentapeptide repeats
MSNAQLRYGDATGATFTGARLDGADVEGLAAEGAVGFQKA